MIHFIENESQKPKKFLRIYEQFILNSSTLKNLYTNEGSQNQSEIISVLKESAK